MRKSRRRDSNATVRFIGSRSYHLEGIRDAFENFENRESKTSKPTEAGVLSGEQLEQVSGGTGYQRPRGKTTGASASSPERIERIERIE